MFEDVIGEWPMYDRFILTSCDDKYFDAYFPRFYKTYTEHWQLPIHVHVVDASKQSLDKLEALDLSYTHCKTNRESLRFQYSYETYCQAQRFILLGHNIGPQQSVTVADVDSYALRKPNKVQTEVLGSDMAFTRFNGRLMATFCNFHHGRRDEARHAAEEMTRLITDTDTIGIDQLVIKKVFNDLPYNRLKHGEWIRHFDVKTGHDLREHNKCLIYHEKGTRGKGKGMKVTWEDIC